MSFLESRFQFGGGVADPVVSDPFLSLVRCPSGVVDAFEGALALILDARPDADLRPVHQQVETWSRRVERRMRHAGVLGDPLAGMMQVSRLLFEEEGLAGDVDTPLDPANCDLALVVQRRRGGPVALGLLQVEVARRAGLPAFVSSYPTRVLVGLAAGPRPLFFDPFRGGRLVLPEWCHGLVGERLEPGISIRPEWAGASSGLRVLERLLTCWKHACLRQSDVDAALRVQDRLVELRPGHDAPLTERARLAIEAGRMEQAVRDLEMAARCCRDSASVASVRRQLEVVRRRVAASR